MNCFFWSVLPPMSSRITHAIKNCKEHVFLELENPFSKNFFSHKSSLLLPYT